MKPDFVSNRQLTLLRKLNQRKYRESKQLFLIEGERAVRQVIENGRLQVEVLFFDSTQSGWEDPFWQQAAEEIGAALVNRGHFLEVSDTENPQGVLAMCRMPEEADAEHLASQNGILLATDAVQDPGNLGTIIRTAGWFGVRGLLSGKGTVDLFHPKLVRSTAGATGSVPYRNVNLDAELAMFREWGWEVLLLDAGTGSVDIRTLEEAPKRILVVGNEANGIDEALFKEGRRAVHIPQESREESVESLNAAIAAGIALYALT